MIKKKGYIFFYSITIIFNPLHQSSTHPLMNNYLPSICLVDVFCPINLYSPISMVVDVVLSTKMELLPNYIFVNSNHLIS